MQTLDRGRDTLSAGKCMLHLLCVTVALIPIYKSQGENTVKSFDPFG